MRNDFYYYYYYLFDQYKVQQTSYNSTRQNINGEKNNYEKARNKENKYRIKLKNK